MSKRKDAAAVALGRKGGKARLKTLTPERRSEIARLGAAATNSKLHGTPKSVGKSARWYGLLLFPADYVWRGTAHASKVLDALHSDSLNIVFWSQNKAEVVARSQEDDLRDRVTDIVEQDWDPTRLAVRRKFKPEAAIQVKALRSLLDARDEGGQS